MAYSPEERQEIYDRICIGIARGKSLRELCDGQKPNIDTIRVWLIEDTAFSAQYARAREHQADYYADEIIEIADTETDPAKARNRMDARKWKASKLKPKVYGDRLAHVGGEKDDNPIRAEVSLNADAFTRAITGLAARSGESGAPGSST